MSPWIEPSPENLNLPTNQKDRPPDGGRQVGYPRLTSSISGGVVVALCQCGGPGVSGRRHRVYVCVCVLARPDSGIDLPVLSRKTVTGGEVDESQAEIWSGVCLTSLE